MNLHVVMNLPVDQAVLVGRMAAKLHRMRQDVERAQNDAQYLWDVQYLQMKLRAERVALDVLYERRSWLLTEGVMRGEWAMCANGHDAYSDDLMGDRWKQATLLLTDFWCCSYKCARQFRLRAVDRLDKEASKPVVLTYESGRQTLLKTMGKTLSGPALARVERA